MIKSRAELLSDGCKPRRHSPMVREVPSCWDPHYDSAFGADLRRVYVEHPDGDYVELAASGALANVAFLNDRLLLGERFGFLYSDPVLTGGAPTEPHLSIWDRDSGEILVDLSGHFGEILGWQWHGEGKLLTWARDFLIRLWDVETGAQLDAFALPREWDGLPAINLLDSRSFCRWPQDLRRRYVEHGRSALKVWHLLIGPDAEETALRGPYGHPASDQKTPETAPRTGCFQELRYEERAYAEATTLSDGRLLAAPATYGACGCCYVWDQADRLLLLLGRPLNGVMFYGLEEAEPGVLRIKDGDRPEYEGRRVVLPEI